MHLNFWVLKSEVTMFQSKSELMNQPIEIILQVIQISILQQFNNLCVQSIQKWVEYKIYSYDLV